MKKKMYIQPTVETERLEIIGQTLCASTQFGGDTSDLQDSQIIGG